MSAPAAWANAQKKAQSGHPTGVKSVKWLNQKNIFHLVNFYQSTLAFAGVIQSFPMQTVCTKFAYGRVTLASLKRCRV